MEIPIKINRATVSDLSEIEFIRFSYLSIGKKPVSNIFEESIRNLTDTFLVARYENHVVGYILGSLQSMIPKHIEVKEIAIHPDHKGQGFGTLLLASLKQVTVEFNYQGICLNCPDELFSYFEMNGFVEVEMPNSLYETNSNFSLVWMNPFFEEIL